MSKTVFITGATAGFGEACAWRFAEQDYKVVLLGRRLERLQALAAALPTKTHIIHLDIRHQEALSEAIAHLPSAFQNIDVLINNAGLALDLSSADQAHLDDWMTMIDTNIKGLVVCTRLLLPHMTSLGCGHIINIGSIAGNDAYPGSNVYGASKAFVGQFSKNLRSDLHGTGIRVTNIEPGLAETEFSLVRFKGDQEKADNVYQNTQALTAKDVAEAVYWAASQPAHVNINRIELMPTCQTWGPLAVFRNEGAQ